MKRRRLPAAIVGSFVLALVTAASLIGVPGASAVAPNGGGDTPQTQVLLSVSPNPSHYGEKVLFQWWASGFHGTVTCNDNLGWIVNGSGSGSFRKQAGVDFTASFQWIVSCEDEDFFARSTRDVIYLPSSTPPPPPTGPAGRGTTDIVSAAPPESPSTLVWLNVSPNPSNQGQVVTFQWSATGFQRIVTCHDNRGWIVNGPRSGSFTKTAGVDFTSSFQWIVDCDDGDFFARGIFDVTYNPPPPQPPPPPPPPPPSPAPPPMELTYEGGFTYEEMDGEGHIQWSQTVDGVPVDRVVISTDGGKAGVYTEDQAKPLLPDIIGQSPDGPGGDQPSSVRCHNLRFWKTARDSISPFHPIVWRFHHHKHWCREYPRILPESLSIDSFFSNIDPNFQVAWDDHGSSYWYRWRGSDTGGHYSRRQGRIDNCILRWGCIGSHYPQIQIWVNGNGAFAARWEGG